MTAAARGWAALRAHRDRALLGVAALALIACLLHPTATLQRARFDQVIVLDITQSMNVADATLNGRPVPRLAYAKHALRRSLQGLPCGSKVGWGVFTAHRSLLLLAPLEVCGHLAELRATLDAIDGRMAWSGNSEVAKGLYSSIGLARTLSSAPSLVFVTDGHESPPVNPRHRPAFNDAPGAVGGLIVGVGGAQPSPIPKFDPLGRPIGVWGADEVAQADPRSRGRGGSVSGEQMAEDPGGDAAAALPGATPGAEHLSALREDYLRLLASETGLAFVRLREPEALIDALTAPGLARATPAAVDLRVALAALAFVLLLLVGRRPWAQARHIERPARRP